MDTALVAIAVAAAVAVAVSVCALAGVLVVVILRWPRREPELAREVIDNMVAAYERGRDSVDPQSYPYLVPPGAPERPTIKMPHHDPDEPDVIEGPSFGA